GIRDFHVTGVQTCALPIFALARETVVRRPRGRAARARRARDAAPLGVRDAQLRLVRVRTRTRVPRTDARHARAARAGIGVPRVQIGRASWREGAATAGVVE